MMTHYRELGLSPDSPFHCVWELRGGDPAPQRIVPDGRMEIVFHRGDRSQQLTLDGWQAQSECVIAGQLTRPLLLRAAGESHTIGIRLKSWAAAAVLGANARSFANTTPDVSAVDRRLTVRVARCLDRARHSLEALAQALETQFGDVLPERRISAAIRYAEAAAGACTVDALARAAELSPRQLERAFDRHVGVGPKTFLRIRRFSRVFAQLAPGANWAQIAADCGYSDQSHLTKDFQQFAGVAPAALLAAGSDLAACFTSLPAGGFLQDTSCD